MRLKCLNPNVLDGHLDPLNTTSFHSITEYLTDHHKSPKFETQVQSTHQLNFMQNATDSFSNTVFVLRIKFDHSLIQHEDMDSESNYFHMRCGKGTIWLPIDITKDIQVLGICIADLFKFAHYRYGRNDDWTRRALKIDSQHIDPTQIIARWNSRPLNNLCKFLDPCDHYLLSNYIGNVTGVPRASQFESFCRQVAIFNPHQWLRRNVDHTLSKLFCKLIDSNDVNQLLKIFLNESPEDFLPTTLYFSEPMPILTILRTLSETITNKDHADDYKVVFNLLSKPLTAKYESQLLEKYPPYTVRNVSTLHHFYPLWAIRQLNVKEWNFFSDLKFLTYLSYDEEEACRDDRFQHKIQHGRRHLPHHHPTRKCKRWLKKDRNELPQRSGRKIKGQKKRGHKDLQDEIQSLSLFFSDDEE